ncbi:MAG: D-2-hydroxyacid dehydrogenase [Armatimonadota bacterium]|nr:D-2-hydroxyacid dehydrogenase [Armatimonadota bacterium]MDR5697586.1 D-2-hydroxyacid dehydrogenase [Armatimonadota bacterium]
MNGRCVVVCTSRIEPRHERAILDVSPRVDLRVVSGEGAEAHAEEAEVLVGWVVPDAFFRRASRLRWIHATSAGVDHLIDTPAWSADVVITNSRGIHAIPIGEHVLGWMLMFARNLHTALRNQIARRWDRQIGGEFHGATVGILGFGAIGREIARLCAAFGARTLAMRRHPLSLGEASASSLPGGERLGGTVALYGPDGLREVLEASDYVVVALPLTAQTRRLIGAREIGWMKQDAVLINVGRGEIVDEAALVSALAARRIRGAALDCFEVEPLPATSPLWEADNVLISPHVSGSSPRYMDRAIPLFCENLRRYLAGEPLLNVVDRARGY